MWSKEVRKFLVVPVNNGISVGLRTYHVPVVGSREHSHICHVEMYVVGVGRVRVVPRNVVVGFLGS